LIEVLFESIEVRCPELAIRRQPFVEVREGLGADAVEAALRVGSDFHESRFLEDAEMFGHRGLAQAEVIDEVADGSLPLAEELEDGQAPRLSQDLEQRSLAHTPQVLLFGYIASKIYSASRDREVA
jgi:hypothetical protein